MDFWVAAVRTWRNILVSLLAIDLCVGAVCFQLGFNGGRVLKAQLGTIVGPIGNTAMVLFYPLVISVIVLVVKCSRKDSE